MELISVIIPVYNTGSYLKRCVDSLVNQTYVDLEIIIVDDGSNQDTTDVCDELSAQDNRIIVFHKQNEGVSIARNFGLKKAHGSYIGFVDSDDWVAADMFQCLYESAISTNADIVYCDAQTVWGNGKYETDTFELILQSQQLCKKDITPSILCEMAGSVCRALYKQELLKDVCFPIGLKFSEDRIFNLYALGKANSIYYLKKELYYRYMREGSCVMSYHEDAVQVATRANNLISTIAKENFGEAFSAEYDKKSSTEFIGFMYSVLNSKINIVEKYQQVKEIAKNETLLQIIEKYDISDRRLRLAYKQHYILLFLLIVSHNPFVKR